MDLRELTASWLKANGYDGLYLEDGMERGCEIDDLMPCDEPNQDCEVAHKGQCANDEDYGWCEGDCKWHMYPVKKEDKIEGRENE